MQDRPHVLLVDDEDDLRTICELAFERDGRFELTTAADGDTASRAFERARPDALVLDVMMPGISGLDLLREARARWPDLPVVLLTARTRAAEVEGYRAAGANAVIAKPFDPRALPERIHRLLEAEPG